MKFAKVRLLACIEDGSSDSFLFTGMVLKPLEELIWSHAAFFRCRICDSVQLSAFLVCVYVLL